MNILGSSLARGPAARRVSLGATPAALPRFRPPQPAGSSQLSAAERQAMGQFLAATRTLHHALDEAIDLVQRSSFGTRRSVGQASVTSTALALSTGTVAGVDRPLAELADFSGVTAGTLRVQSTDIAVDPSTDSLSDVMTAVEATGVVASLDGSNRLVLTDNLTRVQSDDTGFLSAVGIATGNYLGGVTGTTQLTLPSAAANEQTANMEDVSAFSSVSAGTLTIGSTAIAVDPSSQSITDLVAAINASGAATASLSGDTLQLTSSSGDLVLTSDTSGILSAVGLSTGTTAAATSRSPRKANARLLLKLEEVARLTNVLFRAQRGEAPSASSPLTAHRGRFADALSRPFVVENAAADTSTLVRSSLGFVLDLKTLDEAKITSGPAFRFGTVEQRRVRASLASSGPATRTFLVGRSGEIGLLDGLRNAVASTHRAVRSQYGAVGGLMSRYA